MIRGYGFCLSVRGVARRVFSYNILSATDGVCVCAPPPPHTLANESAVSLSLCARYLLPSPT